jgi:hypothetical protein
MGLLGVLRGVHLVDCLRSRMLCMQPLMRHRLQLQLQVWR